MPTVHVSDQKGPEAHTRRVGGRRGRGRGFSIRNLPVFLWNTRQDLGPELREAVQQRRVILTLNSVVGITFRSHSFSGWSHDALDSSEALPTTRSSVQGRHDAGLTRLRTALRDVRVYTRSRNHTVGALSAPPSPSQ